ncbi:radical SAM protein [bacterium]|nr:radical SAM protein [bacterium]
MITSIFRILLAHRLTSFKFVKKSPEYNNQIKKFGLYIHIPFCYKICPYCPYNKIHYDKNLATAYHSALISELDIAHRNFRNAEINSIYVGGGTPTTMTDELCKIIDYIKNIFKFSGDIGVEIHPSDASKDKLDKLKNAGVTMLSIGIQSFQKELLETLGRDFQPDQAEIAIKTAIDSGFNVIDVDLIFDIQGETIDMVKSDIEEAVTLGATQISTYPLIPFTFAKLPHHRIDYRKRKLMLETIVDYAARYGFERTSIWTFNKKNYPRYSSITRNCFLGIGASATSLIDDIFNINTFSVVDYIDTLKTKNKVPSALICKLNQREQRVFWMFWQCYNTFIDAIEYRNLFNENVEEFFGRELFLGRIMGLLSKDNKGYRLTDSGAYYFNVVEQSYSHDYLDKTWALMQNSPWPDGLKL